MTLRLRLFLLLAAVTIVLVVAQTLLVRSLAAELDRDVHRVAVTVGDEILSGFRFKTELPIDGEPRMELFVMRSPPAGAAQSGAASAATGEENGAASGMRQRTPGDPPLWQHRVEVEVPPGRQERSMATWVEHERIEVVQTTPGGEPRRFFEEKVRMGGGALLPKREGAAPSAADEAKALHARRPFLVPDGSGSLLVVGPRIERRIALPTAPLAATLDSFRSRLTWGSLAVLAFGLVAAGFVAHRATRPLERLAAAAERVGGGALGTTVTVDGAAERGDEIGAAIASFNAMSERLASLDRDNRRLAESEHLSELAEVARGLAHTLRNPLNALSLAVEQIAETSDRERAAELAERSRRQIRRIDGSLRSFLALASSPGAATPEPVELGALARETALEALHDAAGRVGIDVEASERVEIAAVAAEIKAVVQALLVNACEASPDGARVALRVARDGEGRARIEIDDEGAGVAPEVAPRLFAPHVTTKPHGSGMGLYLAQRLATHRYGGGVTLEARNGSERPKGTRATLRLGDRKGGSA